MTKWCNAKSWWILLIVILLFLNSVDTLQWSFNWISGLNFAKCGYYQVMHIKKIIYSIFILIVLAACTGPKTTTNTVATAPSATKKKTVIKKIVDGYQLQVLNTTDRSEAINAKSLLLTKYPNQKTFLLFQNPYYKIRFGNFLTKTEAVSYQKKMGSSFTNVFVIPVKIEVKVEE